MDFDLCQIICTVIADINRFRFKRNMPVRMVLSPEPFKSRYYTRLWGNRRFKAAHEADRWPSQYQTTFS